MKFLNLNGKSIIFVTLISVAGITFCSSEAAPSYTETIAGIHCYFDQKITQPFQQMFKDSFSEHSTEKLNLTVKKLKNVEQVVQEVVKDLKIKDAELKHEHKTDTALYAFIHILLKIADRLESYFNIAFTTLTTGLANKLKAAKFATELTAVSKTIVTDKNFKEIDNYLAELQQIAELQEEHNVAKEILEIRSDIKKILEQHKAKSKDNAAALSLLRKRLPY